MTAQFSMSESQYIDGDEVSRNRRRGHLFVQLTVCEVTLVNVRRLNAAVETNVFTSVELDAEFD